MHQAPTSEDKETETELHTLRLSMMVLRSPCSQYPSTTLTVWKLCVHVS